MYKSFRINGLSMALGTLILLHTTGAQAGGGMFRTRLNGMVTGGTSSSPAQGVNQAARQYQSSPAGGRVVSTGAGNGQPQGKANFMSRVQSFRNDFVTQPNVVAAPNGNTGITGIGLPQTSRPFGTKFQHLSGKVIAAPNGNTGITGAGLPQPQHSVLSDTKMFSRGTKVIAAPNGNTGVNAVGLPKYRAYTPNPLTGSGELTPASGQAKSIRMQQTQGLGGDIGDWIDNAASDAARIGSMVPAFILGTVNDGKDLTLDTRPSANVTFNKISNESVHKKTPVSVQSSNKVDPGRWCEKSASTTRRPRAQPPWPIGMRIRILRHRPQPG
jgi:hypothetical protein